jgi:mannose-6-phosphate isomerase-like protein (cupin superfamily)
MDGTRRAFFEMLAAGAALPLMQATRAPEAAGRAMASDDGELCFVGTARDPVRLKVSSQTDPTTHLAMIVQDVSPGTAIPVHLHEREDEIILIQSGTGVASLGETDTAVGAGSVLWVPKGTWHGGRNTGPGILKWTGIYSPAGFEGYFREISRPPGVTPPQRSTEEWEALDRRYGIRYRH